MKADGILEFLSACGVQESQIRVGDEWVSCPCILAPMTHAHGKDRNPSFSVSIHDDRVSSYHCFGCMDQPQPIWFLLWMIRLMTGSYPYDLCQILVRHEILDGEGSGNDPYTPKIGLNWEGWAREYSLPHAPIPQPVLDLRIPLYSGDRSRKVRDCESYLEGRGIAPEASVRYGVSSYPGISLLVFTHTLPDGRAAMMRARKINQKRVWTLNHKWFGLDDRFPNRHEMPSWFGAHLVNWSKPVMIVEGEIDVLSLSSLGYQNSISPGGTFPTHEQFSILSCRTILIGLDSDTGGQRATHKMINRLKRTHSLYVINWSDVGCKDPGDLSDTDQIRAAVESAEKV